MPTPEEATTEKTYEQWEEEYSLVPKRKRTRMENWQLKLLDLSLRNNLLNAGIDRSQVRLLLPSVAQLEDALADNKTFIIRNLPAEYAEQLERWKSGECSEVIRNNFRKLAADMFAHKQLLAINRNGAVTDEQLERRVRALYLAARRDMEESGSSTLNLACGFLKWYRKGDTERALYAPLLLMPVRLTRPSVQAGFLLRSGDEETRINLTLLELLKTEYGIRIPALEGELPTDASGVDVPLIMQTVRDAVRHQQGWEVIDHCTLGTFSFAKYLMWKDMADRQEALLQNDIVRHLAAEQHTPFPAQVDFPDPAGLDDNADARTVYTPLSSDSSQLAAVLAAARGKNFVLIGPPGTGKSQTIANMIAHCLGHGKTVLFVAEKAAALHVVYKRLKRIGLGDFCLELHSNKANKKEVLAQFKAALDHAKPLREDRRWEGAVKSMETLRSQLNSLPREMHATRADGTSLFDDICLMAQHPDAPGMRPCPVELLSCTAEHKEAMLAQAHELALRFTPLRDALPGAASSITPDTYTFTWEDDLADALQAYATAAREWQERFADLTAQLPLEGGAATDTAELCRLVEIAAACGGHDVRALLPGQAEEALPALRECADHAEAYRELKDGLTLPYPDSTLDEPELPLWLRTWKEAQLSNIISRFFAVRRVSKALQVQAFSRQKPDCYKDLTALIAMREHRDAARKLAEQSPLPHFTKGLDTRPEDVAAAEEWAARLQGLSRLLPLAEKWLSGRAANPLAPGKPTAPYLQALQETEAKLADLQRRLFPLLGSNPPEAKGEGVTTAREWAQALLELRESWRAITLWNEQAKKARHAGFGPMVDALLAKRVAPAELESVALANFSRLRLKAAMEGIPTLNRFTANEHETRLRDFGAKDNDVLKLAGEHIVSYLSARAALVNAEANKTELGFLQHEVSKQRMHKAPRTLLANIPHVAPLLKPCMLMSPLSVAQYLSPDAAPYDIVIFDEASQIPVWDAIGAIARGKSAVIVGDPRQMPPTSFFSRAKSQDDEEDDDVVVQDMESILDECRACGIPEMNLSWHYRSKSESLIAFSNHQYYEGKLVTFPAPVTTDTALQYHKVEGTYLRGAKRTNPTEAKALVEHVLDTLRAPGFRYTELTSIGIVTFNTQQQKLIEDLLDKARAEDASLEPFFSEDNPEAVFVKNLENVQGDERGIIYFSTTFGPDEKGVTSMNFGPLNLTGGERRLNVAITRARAALHVFSSLTPESIDLSRTKARGAADLRAFLECAALGASRYFGSKPSANQSGEGFAQAIARGLTERGWACRTNVGVSGFRIDLAVEHPEQKGTVLAGIRTDGPGYAAACTARDRDILRESVLTGLGWSVLHLWSPEWYRNPKACLDALDAALHKALKQGPPPLPTLPSLV